MTKKAQAQFPKDIKLKRPPLVEAWFTIRWDLIIREGIARDPGYFEAVDAFYERVKDQYNYQTSISVGLPEELAPYAPRVRFQKSSNGTSWPLLQLGPGVATANFTSPYSWDEFKETILYLLENLAASYQKYELAPNFFSIRYRNAIPFDFSKKNVYKFLAEKMNLHINLPRAIPSGTKGNEVNMTFEYPTAKPKGHGSLFIATAIRHIQPGDIDQEQIMFDLELKSIYENAPSLADKQSYVNWLNNSHDVLHDWFFSVIEGSLHEEFNGEG